MLTLVDESQGRGEEGMVAREEGESRVDFERETAGRTRGSKNRSSKEDTKGDSTGWRGREGGREGAGEVTDRALMRALSKSRVDRVLRAASRDENVEDVSTILSPLHPPPLEDPARGILPILLPPRSLVPPVALLPAASNASAFHSSSDALPLAKGLVPLPAPMSAPAASLARLCRSPSPDDDDDAHCPIASSCALEAECVSRGSCGGPGRVGVEQAESRRGSFGFEEGGNARASAWDGAGGRVGLRSSCAECATAERALIEPRGDGGTTMAATPLASSRE